MRLQEIKIGPLYNPIGQGTYTEKISVKPITGMHRGQKKGREYMAKSQNIVMRNVEAPSMARAIKEKCLDCSGGGSAEVRDCTVINCPLFPYRFGKKPKAAIHYLEKHYTVEFK